MSQSTAFWRILWVDVQRGFRSPGFWLAPPLIFAAMAIATSGKTNSIDLINLLAVGVFGSGTFLLTLCILPVLPYSMAYAADHRAQAVRLWSVRIGIARYAVSKFIAAVAMGMLAYVLGMALFLAVSSIGLPLFTEMTVDDGYACLLAEGRPIAYLLCFVLHYAFSAGLFAGCALFFSTCIPNAFAAMVLPILCYFVYLRICNFVAVPEAVSAVELVQSIYAAGSPLQTLFTKAGAVLAILAVLCFLSVILIRRRVFHE